MTLNVKPPSPESDLGRPCILLDCNVPRIERWLEMRGYRALRPYACSDDTLIERQAEITGCVVVTFDRDFEGMGNAIVLPSNWARRYNTRELATKIVKIVAGGMRWIWG